MVPCCPWLIIVRTLQCLQDDLRSCKSFSRWSSHQSFSQHEILTEFQFLGVYCFNSLVAKWRGNMSLEYSHSFQACQSQRVTELNSSQASYRAQKKNWITVQIISTEGRLSKCAQIITVKLKYNLDFFKPQYRSFLHNTSAFVVFIWPTLILLSRLKYHIRKGF